MQKGSVVKRLIFATAVVTVLMSFFISEKALATDASQVSIVAQKSTGIVSVTVLDASLTGKDISAICYSPGWGGNPNDWSASSKYISYLHQVTLGSDLKFNFRVKNGVEAGEYTIILGTSTGRVIKTFNFDANNAALPDGKVLNVAAVQSGEKMVRVTWNGVIGADLYRIYRSSKARSGYTKIGTSSTTEFTDKKVYSGKRYYYKISVDKKTFSDPATVQLLKTPSIKVVATGKAKSKKKKALVTWKKDSVASGYRIYMSTSKNGKYKLSRTNRSRNKIKATIGNLKRNRKYYFKVCGYIKTRVSTVAGRFSYAKSIKFKK